MREYFGRFWTKWSTQLWHILALLKISRNSKTGQPCFPSVLVLSNMKYRRFDHKYSGESGYIIYLLKVFDLVTFPTAPGVRGHLSQLHHISQIICIKHDKEAWQNDRLLIHIHPPTLTLIIIAWKHYHFFVSCSKWNSRFSYVHLPYEDCRRVKGAPLAYLGHHKQ